MQMYHSLLQGWGGAPGIWSGGTEFWPIEGGGAEKIFLFKGGTEDFHKKDFLGFIFRLY